ncbi:hypothetical protein AOZ06_48175 [Kibdelosporangium phytohabitans]|uniref:Uncharacterized protein n=2 Tax=Kibdelosporangium phytohabitans TaxID=860235 RepID=A0A0N9IFH8_9PSEU|nr:hypothetical protein AOZ06_48175 [Kibdelosporangium phytohabitans]
MDAANTLQIPRVVVSSLDDKHHDSEATMVVGHPLADPQPTQRQPSPRRPQPFPASQGQIQTPPHGVPVQAPPVAEPEPQPEPKPEGMVPTLKKPSPRPSLSQRLDGTL